MERLAAAAGGSGTPVSASCRPGRGCRGRCRRSRWTQRPLPLLEQLPAPLRRHLHPAHPPLRRLGHPQRPRATSNASSPPATTVGVDVANPLLGPVLGPRSVMLLEEPEHMTRRKLMLPAFHGEAVRPTRR